MEGLRKRAGAILGALEVTGARSIVGGDPRGPCMWIAIPGIRGDGMEGGEQLAVY